MSDFSALFSPPISNTSPRPRKVQTSLPMPGALNKSNAKAHSIRRSQFVLFIDTLLRCLEVHASPNLKLQAKQVISECTRLNRLGNPNFSPLMKSIMVHLRELVGEVHWAQVHKSFKEIYMARQQRVSTRANMNGSGSPPCKPRDSWQQLLAMGGASASTQAGNMGDSLEILTAALNAGPRDNGALSPELEPRRDSLQQYLDAYSEDATRRSNSFQLAQDSMQQLLAMNGTTQSRPSIFPDSLQLLEPLPLLDSLPTSSQGQGPFSGLYGI